MEMTDAARAVLDTIRNRRSMRSFKSGMIPEDVLDLILEAGTWAPTGKGLQSPVIVVLTKEDDRRSFSRLNARYSHNRAEGFDPFYGAPVYALVLADSSSSNWLRDGSCVPENMMIAAEALGIGSCWINREEEVFDSVEGKELLKKWGLDAGKIRGVGALALGYAGRAPGRAAPRKKDYIIKV